MANELKEAFLRSWFDVPESVHWAHGMSNEVEKEVSESFDRAIAALNTRPAAPVDGLERYNLDQYYSEIRKSDAGCYVRFDQAEAIIAAERAKAEEFADEIKEAAYEVWPDANDVGSDAPDIIRELGKERDEYQAEAEELKNRLYRAEADNAALTAQKNGLHDEVQFMRKAAKENRERAEALETQLAAARKALEDVQGYVREERTKLITVDPDFFAKYEVLKKIGKFIREACAALEAKP